MIVRRVVTLVLAAGVLISLWGLVPPLRPTGAGAAEHAHLEPLAIETPSGVHAIEIEIARTPERRAVGLMYRTALAPDRGMLFDFGTTRPITMWMKNTLIPLDMFFVDRTGRIVGIAAETTPLSERRIRSGEPVRFVLEMIGGSASRLAVKPGDRLRHPVFDRVAEPGGSQRAMPPAAERR